MLTSDLVRARRRGDLVTPLYVDPADPSHLERASTLCTLFDQHLGRRRGDLDDALSTLVGEGTDYLLHRGLAKLLFDRCTFEIHSPIEPDELRRRVFALAAQHHPVAQSPGDPLHPTTRSDVLTQIASDLGLAPEAVELALYADLEREQILRTFEPLTPAALLERYNVALAQAVLIRATRIELHIPPGNPKRYRQLFRYIKFFGLIHTARGDRAMGYRVTLDGPASLFQLSTKYGVQLAEFLPALLLCEGWSLQAELLWGKERRPATFKLDPRTGLVSHYKSKGVYETEEERAFVARFEAHAEGWTLERKPELIDLGGEGILIPDFVLKHRESGREALLEIIGFWRKGYLEARLELLRRYGPPNLILAVSSRLRSSTEQLSDWPGEVVLFKDVIKVKEVLERAERVALAPPLPRSA